MKLLTFADTGVRLLSSCFNDPDDFCEPLKANGARSIGDHYVQNICEVLKFNNTLSNLDLKGNSIADVGAQYLSEALKVNNTVTNLDLKGNSISDVGAQYLSEALKVNKTVTISCVDLPLYSIGHSGESDDLPVVMSSVLHLFEAKGQHK